MELFDPSIEQLVTEIVAVNNAWKEAKYLFGYQDNHLANSLRDLKASLQVRLLRSHAPESVYLQKDSDPNEDYEEDLYGVQLVKSVKGRRDAAHMPIRVAEEILSTAELKQFVRD